MWNTFLDNCVLAVTFHVTMESKDLSLFWVLNVHACVC